MARHRVYRENLLIMQVMREGERTRESMVEQILMQCVNLFSSLGSSNRKAQRGMAIDTTEYNWF